MINVGEIQISQSEVHKYSFAWDKIIDNKPGVTLTIDSNGDGTIDNTIIGGTDMNYDDVELQTKTAVDVDPDTLNLKSNGNYITVYITLNCLGYGPKDIVTSSILLNGKISPTKTQIDNKILVVKFDRKAVQDILTIGDKVNINIMGKLTNGKVFSGDDSIKVIK